MIALVLLCCVVGIHGQTQTIPNNTDLHLGLTEHIGNFSVETLYYTAKRQQKNLIMSPITIWTALSVIAEGASGETLIQINKALRTGNRLTTRSELGDIMKWLVVNTTTVQLQKLNTIFVNGKNLLQKDFVETSKEYYATDTFPVDFSKADEVADIVNSAIKNVTHGKIPKLLSGDDLKDALVVLTSALYFSGQWTVPFNTSSTMKSPFYDSNGTKIGEVNMMYNRFTYPFANIRQLQARVIELPYGKENRLSMLVMMPNPGVSLEDMFFNFQNVTLDTVFNELRISQEEYGEDEVDCLLPRFQIESDIDLTDILKTSMNISDLFDEGKAFLPKMARTPLYINKVIHKAVIEVTEDGTVAAGVTAAEFSNRIGIIRFEANRPFTYLIIEKVTNSIVFGGVYKYPSLF